MQVLPEQFYDRLLDSISEHDAEVTQLIIGLTWTLCRSEQSLGMAMTPAQSTRTLPWPGTLKGRKLKDIAPWIMSWNPFEASVGLSAINAVLPQTSSAFENSHVLDGDGPGNLRVFEYFKPRLAGKKVVVIGRYPGLEEYENTLDFTVLERSPGASDLPDQACEYIIPEADWVFVSGTTITNKTFPRIAELATDANMVLMGPSTPWWDDLSEYGVDYLVGVESVNNQQLIDTISEGGGTRTFEGGVRYRCFDFTPPHMEVTKNRIAQVVSERNKLKQEMEQWYQQSGGKRFPQMEQLQSLDNELSKLDSRYKRLWDANNADLSLLSEGEGRTR